MAVEGFAEMDAPQARRGIETLLRIKGEKTIPELADVRDLKFVYDVNAGGMLSPTFRWGIGSSLAVNGVASGTILSLGPKGFTVAGALGTQLVDLDQQNGRILSSQLTLTFDAAGALAFNGKTVAVAFQVRASDTALTAHSAYTDTQTIATGILSYNYILNAAFWKGLIGLNTAHTIAFGVNDGTVLPANTTARLRLYSVVAGVGVQLPF